MIDQLDIIYFSPAGTTARIAGAVAMSIGAGRMEEHDLARAGESILIPPKHTAIFAVPVYSGRVPALAARAIERFRGEQTPAIIIAVYGNRDYDDALLELRDIVSERGFRVVSAGAFVARHSIFPAVASGRPDREDIKAASAFGRRSEQIISSLSGDATPCIAVKGNFPYRPAKAIPIKPRSNRNCNKCGACARSCPAGAISKANPRLTNGDRCIACARCIAICPRMARGFSGLLYKVAGRSFASKYSARREAEVFFI